MKTKNKIKFILINLLLIMMIFISSCMSGENSLGAEVSSAEIYQDLEFIGKEILRTKSIPEENVTNFNTQNTILTQALVTNNIAIDQKHMIRAGWYKIDFKFSEDEIKEIEKEFPKMKGVVPQEGYYSFRILDVNNNPILGSEKMSPDERKSNNANIMEWDLKLSFSDGTLVLRNLSGMMASANVYSNEFEGIQTIQNTNTNEILINFPNFKYKRYYDKDTKIYTEVITSDLELEKYYGNWEYIQKDYDVSEWELVNARFNLEELINESQIFSIKNKKKVGKIKFKNNFKDFDIELDEE
ncbi:hypothetical protein ACFL2K_02845 [Candidatus Margulisiibacteriota bacterium]